MPVERPETIRQVVDLLERGLENAGQSGWEVITDCRIADARPDIVVFNPRVGIAFFVVQESTSSAMSTWAVLSMKLISSKIWSPGMTPSAFSTEEKP